MLYPKSPRQWVRLVVSVTLTTESHLWHVWKIQSTCPWAKSNLVLPAPVMTDVTEFLRSNNDLGQDRHLSVFLGGQHNETQGLSHIDFTDDCERLDSKEFLQTVTRLAFHMHCRTINERELGCQVPISPTQFAAFLDGRWVHQERFCSNKVQDDVTYHNFLLLCLLRGNTEINPFIGVILDDDDMGLVNSFVCELPGRGLLHEVLQRASRSNCPGSWSRRIKWCRQIVAGTAKVHRHGRVVGSFGLSPNCGITINADDNAVLFSNFRETHTYQADKAGRVPSERQNHSLRPGKQVVLDMSMDIYQLGMVLWGIAMQRPSRLRVDFCSILECPQEKGGASCKKPHAFDLDPLPIPGDDVPDYLRDIIWACREASVDRRPAAWQLLEMFPAAHDGGEGDFDREPPPLPDEDGRLGEENKMLTVCDNCATRCNCHFYHCEVCSEADYDLCPDCFAKDYHCLDPGHYLQERRSHDYLRDCSQA